MLVSYTSEKNQDGIISNVLHLSVTRCVRRNREKERYLDIQVHGYMNHTGDGKDSPREYHQTCTSVEVYDEETGRLIRSWQS